MSLKEWKNQDSEKKKPVFYIASLNRQVYQFNSVDRTKRFEGKMKLLFGNLSESVKSLFF